MAGRITTGGDIDSYCTKCRLNLEHIIVAMVGEAIVKVKCKTCGSVHRFKGNPAERLASQKKEGAASKTLKQPQALWEEAVEAAHGPELSYEMESAYRAGDLIVHNIFGKGVVLKTSFKKCSVLFRDKERVLTTLNT